jgi:signal transduction histidine kinase/HD-GYP domain-containing protein (c-di-GMP phosphodiesterase class II)
MLGETVLGVVAGRGLHLALVAALAVLVLAEVAVIALRRQGKASALAEAGAARAKDIEGRAARRADNLARILQTSNRLNANLDLEPLLDEIVEAVRQSLGFRMVLLRIFDEETNSFEARAFAGLDADAVRKLSSKSVPLETFRSWLKDEFKIGQSYFISHKRDFWSECKEDIYIPDLGAREEGEWHPEDTLFVPLWIGDQRLVGYLSVDDPVDRKTPTAEAIETLEIFANQTVTAIENARLYGRLEENIIELRDMTKRLRELNEIKSNFVATVSHELRTPLTSIRAYAETLTRNWGTSPRETEIEFLSIIEEEAHRLAKIVEDMLDLSRMESGKVEVKKADMDLRKILKEVNQVLLPSARKKYLRLDLPLEGPPISLSADDGMMKQLFLNLIGNAIKFTPEGGVVTVSLEDRESTVEVSVEDNGIGIPPSKIHRVFDEFYQVDSSSTRRFGGVGLGLAIAKNIVEWHDGRIWAESETGNGAKFTVRLPKRKAVAATRADVTDVAEGWQCEKRIPELIVDMIAEIMGAKTASLMLLNEEADELFVSAAMGLDEAVMKMARVKVGESISGWVAKNGKPLLIRDIEDDPRFQRSNRPQYESHSLLSVPLKIDGRVVGVINVTNKVTLAPFTESDGDILKILSDRVTAVLAKVRQYEGIKTEFNSICTSLKSVIDARRLNSNRRGDELTALVVDLASSLGLGEEDVALLRYVSRIYDVGMVKVGERILHKRGGLGVSEYESVKRHPREGVDIVGPIEFLEQVKQVIMHHHERYDGGGYPDGLKGEAIPIGARILAVVDAYSSMLSERPYRSALSRDEAVGELRKCSVTQFDPAVVEAFIEVLGKHQVERAATVSVPVPQSADA